MVKAMRLKGGLTDSAIGDFSSACAAMHAHVRPAYIKDDDLRYVAANAAFCALARTSLHKLIRKDSEQVTAALYSAYTEEIERQVLDFKKPLTALQIYPDNQKKFHIELSPFSDGKGTRFVMGFFEACDIEERQECQPAADRQPMDQARLCDEPDTSNVVQLPVRDTPHVPSGWQGWQTALDAVDGAIAVWDREYRLMACNRAFMRKFPLVSDWSVGQSVTQIVTQVAATGLVDEANRDPQAWIAARVAERKAGIDQDVRIVHKHGTGTLWRNATTPTGQRICIATDISGVGGSLSRSADSAGEKSDFFSQLNHEIRTPMNGIFGMAELLERSCIDPKHRKIASIIASSAQAVRAIFDDIHDYSSIETGNLLLKHQPFSLMGIVNDVMAVMAAPVAEKDIAISANIDGELPDLLMGDAIRIRQILSNLVSNAVKHTDAGQVRINLDTMPSEDGCVSVRFSVQDQGKGLSEEKQKNLFDLFALAREEPDDRHEGSGLGLALSARMVALMGGEITVESQINKGSTFQFVLSLPIVGSTARTHRQFNEEAQFRVLFICADPAVRQDAVQMSSQLPFDSCVAMDVAEGRRVLSANWQLDLATDLVIVCSGSDTSAGLSVVQNIFEDSRHQNLPLILLGAGERHFSADEMKRLGVDAFVHFVSGCDVLQATALTIMGETGKRVLSSDNQNNAAPIIALNGASSVLPTGPTPGRHVKSVPISAGSDRDIPADKVEAEMRDPVRVLVAEDNAVNQIVFSQILQQLGLTFRVVSNGIKAIEDWKKYRPDIILMDVAMPLMDGFEATQAIRQAEAAMGVRVPIVGVTAYTFMNDHERCLEAGMDDCLCKPISRRKLLEKLSNHLPDLDSAMLAETGRS
tara:strand:- start:218680 stop:221286 length:2607 start_codon:yes stop_codon:yes gene_type:complete